MNKTTSVNIGGYNFVMDEVAYERLSDYLERYRCSMSSEERDDVMYDIECRIAEIFGGVHCQRVITLTQVEEVIATIGEPEQTAQEGADDAAGDTQSSGVRIEKKLYRDTSDCTIGGVCSGLAAYFNISVILVRILFIFALFWGVGFLIYIVMWLIVPQARGAQERLAMSGGFDSQTGSRVDVRSKEDDTSENSRGGCLGCFLRVVFIFFAILIGLPVLVSLICVVVGMLAAIVGVLGAMITGGAALSTVPICTLGGFALSGFAAIAALLFVFLPVIALLLLLVKVLFRVKWRMWPLFVVMLILWLASVVCIICNIAEIAPKFSHKATSSETLETLSLDTDSLVVMPLEDKWNSDSTVVVSSINKVGDVKFLFVNNEKERIVDIELLPKLIVRRAKKGEDDGKLHFVGLASSRGETSDAAERAMEAIRYDYKFVNDTLYLGRRIHLAEGAEWRAQDMVFELVVPKGVYVETNYYNRVHIPAFYYSYKTFDPTNISFSSSEVDYMYEEENHRYIELVGDSVQTSDKDSILVVDYKSVFCNSELEKLGCSITPLSLGLYKINDVMYDDGINVYSLEKALR